MNAAVLQKTEISKQKADGMVLSLRRCMVQIITDLGEKEDVWLDFIQLKFFMVSGAVTSVSVYEPKV